MFAALSELVCQVLCLAFKSELLRPSHSSYHITPLLQTSKSKNTALRAEKRAGIFGRYSQTCYFCVKITQKDCLNDGRIALLL